MKPTRRTLAADQFIRAMRRRGRAPAVVHQTHFTRQRGTRKGETHTMPACYQLFPKGTNTAARLADVDAAICKHFNAPVDDRYWFADWHNSIGFLLATSGYPLGSLELRDKVAGWSDLAAYTDRLLAVLDFLAEHYTSIGFYTRHKD